MHEPFIRGICPSHTRTLCMVLRQWHPTPVLLPGKSHGRWSLVGCSPRGREESDMTERLHFHFSLLCIGEGNGNPLRCSCLENPRDGGAWLAAVSGIAQSRTQLKRLSSRSSSSNPLQYSGLENSMDCSLTGLLPPWDFPGKKTGVGCHFLLQGNFPTQGSNLGLLHYRQMLYHLSHKGSPRDQQGVHYHTENN